jgi:hypothetical protein
MQEAKMIRLVTIAAVGGLMMSTVLAQTQSPSSPPATKPADQNTGMTTDSSTLDVKPSVIPEQKPDQWLASKFKGTDVIGQNNEKIGDIDDILFDQKGTIVAYVVGVGGFLGLGSKDVALAPAAFHVEKNRNEYKLKLSMTKDELKQAAEFKRYSPSSAPTASTPNRPATQR